MWVTLSPAQGMGEVISVIYFFVVGLGIKWHMKVDVPQNKVNQIKQNLMKREQQLDEDKWIMIYLNSHRD